MRKTLHILLLPILSSIIPASVRSIKNTAIENTDMNINLLVTSEAWSWSALDPRIQETDCAASGTGAPHLWAPGPGRTPPLRAKQPGGSGAKPCSLSTSARTASTPPYWQKRRRIMAKIKERNLAAWRTQIKCQDSWGEIIPVPLCSPKGTKLPKVSSVRNCLAQDTHLTTFLTNQPVWDWVLTLLTARYVPL